MLIARRLGCIQPKLHVRYSAKAIKKTTKSFALNHFDEFYGSTFENWSSIRLGLLCPNSYCAVVNSFAGNECTTLFDSLGALSITEILNQNSSYNMLNQDAEVPPKATENPPVTNQTQSRDIPEDEFVQPHEFIHRDSEFVYEMSDMIPKGAAELTKNFDENALVFPEHLKAYVFPRGKYGEFPPPEKDSTGLFNYYLMDASSLLPVLALGIEKDDHVGDLCASPGGKSLAIAFSLKFGKLLCNDASAARLNKMKTVLNSYLPDVSDWKKRVLVSKINLLSWQQNEAFDKILLDVPCTNDRLSVTRNDNNIFKLERFQERMNMPMVQSEMLRNSLRGLKPRGSLVYSTCSLSPLQNDGVIHHAVSLMHQDTDMLFCIKDLSRTFGPLHSIFKFYDNCKYGQLVLPFLPLNYGPMYISKISRLK